MPPPLMDVVVTESELLPVGALALACLFAAAILFRSYLRRRTRPPLVAAILVLAAGIVAVSLALLGVVPYRTAVTAAFVTAILAVLISARVERGHR